MNLSFSERAVAKLNELFVAAKTDSPTLLQISIQGGGCSGLSYKLEWVEEYPKVEHRVFPLGHFLAVIDKKSALYLDGVTLDYSDGLAGRGFEFNNPQAKRTCGCGSSFSP